MEHGLFSAGLSCGMSTSEAYAYLNVGPTTSCYFTKQSFLHFNLRLQYIIFLYNNAFAYMGRQEPTLSYNASAVNIYNATSSLVRFILLRKNAQAYTLAL
jgi:hypothetical protein